MTGNDPIREVEATWPLKAQVDGAALRIWLEEQPEWVARITAVVFTFVDSGGTTRTAYSWVKQQEAPGGQWVDSSDGIGGDAAAVPPKWPAFGIGTTRAGVGDFVRIRPGRQDTRTDPAVNYGMEWYFWPTLDAGGGNALVTGPPVGPYYPALLMDESDPAPGVPTSTQMWLTERNKGKLYAGEVYGFTCYGKTLVLGKRQAATTDDQKCCPPSSPFTIPCCPSGVSQPVYSQTRLVSDSDCNSFVQSFLTSNLPITGQGPWTNAAGTWTAAGRNSFRCFLSGGLSACPYFAWWLRCVPDGLGGGTMYLTITAIPAQNYDGTFSVSLFSADPTDPNYNAGSIGPFAVSPTACDPFCYTASTKWIFHDGVNPACHVTLKFIFAGSTAFDACGGSGGGGGGTLNCATIQINPTVVKAPLVWPAVFANTSGTCSPGSNGQTITFNYYSYGGANNYQMLASGYLLNGRESYAFLQLGSGGTGTVFVYWRNRIGDWDFATGTISRSGTVWTLSVTGIDTGDGCVVSLGGTFDTASCT